MAEITSAMLPLFCLEKGEKNMAERAGISRSSLWKVESGNPAVAIGTYAAVLHALNNMNKDFLLIAKEYGISCGQIEDMRPVFSECYKND